jgi:tetratricopeptide (TPR) repeat protein
MIFVNMPTRDFRAQRAVQHDEDLTPRAPIRFLDTQPILSIEKAADRVIPSSIVEEAVAHADDGEPFHGLTVDEKAAIHLYTMEPRISAFKVYAELNRALRHKSRKHVAPWLRYLKLLFSALLKLPRVSRTQILWRGVSGDHSHLYRDRVGQIVRWWGLTSLTPSLDAITPFFGPGPRTVFVVTGGGGFDISGLSSFPGEDEVLLPPGCRLRVEGVSQEGGGALVELRLVDAEGAISAAGLGGGEGRIAALMRELRDVASYPAQVGRGGGELMGLGVTYRAGAMEVVVGARGGGELAVGLWALGRSLLDGERVVVEGRLMEARELFLESVSLDATLAEGFNALGAEMGGGEVLELKDGRVMCATELFDEAIKFNKDLFMPYLNLATRVDDDGEVTLRDGRRLDKRALLVEALRCNPDSALAYFTLASTLSRRGVVELSGGGVFDKRALLLEGLRRDEDDENALVALARLLAPRDVVKIAEGGGWWTKKALYARATALSRQ